MKYQLTCSAWQKTFKVLLEAILPFLYSSYSIFSTPVYTWTVRMCFIELQNNTLYTSLALLTDIQARIISSNSLFTYITVGEHHVCMSIVSFPHILWLSSLSLYVSFTLCVAIIIMSCYYHLVALMSLNPVFLTLHGVFSWCMASTVLNQLFVW